MSFHTQKHVVFDRTLMAPDCISILIRIYIENIPYDFTGGGSPLMGSEFDLYSSGSKPIPKSKTAKQLNGSKLGRNIISQTNT